jgi:hypothetical protein
MTAILTNPLRVGLRQERVIPPQCLVIFGASGDLTHRKLVPALFELYRQRRLPSEFAVLGCARPWLLRSLSTPPLGSTSARGCSTNRWICSKAIT